MYIWHTLDPKRLVLFLREWCNKFVLSRESDTGDIKKKYIESGIKMKNFIII